ncbi:MAG: class I SAM-dependent methyltransferase [Promethearchaeota archaeon]
MNDRDKTKILSKYHHIFENEIHYYSKSKPQSDKIINLEDESFFRLVNLKFKDLIGNVKGKKILDVGCGRGDLSLYLAQRGAIVTGIDLSKNFVDLCNIRKKQYNLNVDFIVMNAQIPDFEDNTFDIIVGSRIIHHLPDLELFYQECKRLLKRKGFISFIEPLKKNPIVELNRKYFAPKSRTKHEHPLFMKDVLIAKKVFENLEHYEYYLLSPFAMFFKNFLRKPILLRILYKILNRVESPITKINFLKQYCWQIIFKCIKI